MESSAQMLEVVRTALRIGPQVVWLCCLVATAGCSNHNAALTPRTVHEAALFGDVKHLKALLVGSADVDSKDCRGRTPLYYAARGGHVAAANFLLSKGAKADLHIAAGIGNARIAESLLARGANVNARNDVGVTPLHWAAKNGHVAVAGLLIAKGAAIDATDGVGQTPLHVAANFYRSEMVRFLLSRGANANARDRNGDTPLHQAVEGAAFGDDKRIEELLINHGAAIDGRNNEGYSPLYTAVRADTEGLARFLISKGGTADLHVWSGLGDVGRVRSLLTRGAHVNGRDSLGYTPLHWAAEGGKLGVARLLVSEGADVNAEARDGCTPLRLAELGRKSLAVAFSSMEASGKLRRLYRARCRDQMVEFLESKGAKH